MFCSDDINHGIYVYTLDIDECGISGLGGMCSQVCVNTPGSYECQCNIGYRLSSDGFTCEGIYIATTHNICSMAFKVHVLAIFCSRRHVINSCNMDVRALLDS